MKGILLAGGLGTRLYPATIPMNKHLLPIHDKPMIYYSLTTLMLAGIRDILIISTPESIPIYQQLLKQGRQWGIKIEYVQQDSPKGIPEAFLLGENFLSGESVCLMLGDNLLYGEALSSLLQQAKTLISGAHIFGYTVNNPDQYGVINLDSQNNPKSIEEKPLLPKSSQAIIGLYFYENSVIDLAKHLQPSKRGELEISQINQHYLEKNQLTLTKLDTNIAWLDTGTHESRLEATQLIQTLEHYHQIKIGSPEAVAWKMQFINDSQLANLAEPLLPCPYAKYLMGLIP